MSTVEPGQAVAIIDTGGGTRPTITTKAWEILGGDTGLTTQMQPYQSATSISCRVCSGMTKATLPGFSQPVILLVHSATVL